ncbi:MAG: histidine kinase [Comamonas sp. SCN 67-35]|uniref:sensor histidine kinase n=1 Tax=unclassified Comamonas TaxID=2638500 RepID=UPI0008692F28|nr:MULTISPECIES: sensor histidine kinase [unclassified Comamonas]MBN9329005.1 sensor histidine kinase [Comamonas sp.]ODU38701.1 MAG: histidine kinase [Comamonas sp. SCN 67-35]OJX01879.1 MAG: ATP-binding protein [Burkholderiales bacterium 66-26]
MMASLRWRLLAGTLAWVALTLAGTGWGLTALFRDHITQQWQAQLTMQLDELSGAIDWVDGQLEVGAMPEARFAQPLSGWYWQIDTRGASPRAAAARSRSLWDETLALPADPGRGDRLLHLSGAQGRALLALARTLELPEDGAPPLRVAVAVDEQLVAEPIARFTRLLLFALAVLAVGLLAAVALQLRLLLAPLALLREKLAAVRSGGASALAGRFPQELTPLVDEFNHVLSENAEMVQRARAQAGNLAHAVNTPLTILANAAGGQDTPLATLVREQAEIARRQVDWHLARARASAAVRATGLATPVLEPLAALARTMARLHAARGVSFEVAPGAQEARFRGEAQDLYEMLGNLLDNAGKWARSRVLADARQEGAQIVFTIDDDGPGIPEAERERMFERGAQLSDTNGGAGLGLDIVRTLAQTYGGRIEALASPLGGLRMRLVLPASA